MKSAKSRPHKKIRVVIVEDHPMFRERLGQLINKADDMVVAGEADNIRDGLHLIQRIKPSIAIVDISLKGSNGLELLKDLRAAQIDLPVLVLTMHEAPLHVRRAFAAGASGYVTKRDMTETLLEAIRSVLRGEKYGAPRN